MCVAGDCKRASIESELVLSPAGYINRAEEADTSAPRKFSADVLGKSRYEHDRWIC